MEIYKTADIKNNEPCAIALGYFDGVHIGHSKVIMAAKDFELKTIVLTFHRFKKNGNVCALISEELKDEALSQLGVDMTVYLDFEEIRDLTAELFFDEYIIKRLHAKAVVCGFNYKCGRDGAGPDELMKICDKNGIKLKTVEPVTFEGIPVSSTRIRKLVENGHVGEAGALMGRPFAFYYEIVHGKKIGRTIGSPTINQELPDWQIRPRFGVYASITRIGDKIYPSVTNVGVKPTVGSEKVLAETNILNFSGDLYGRRLKVELIEFLRDERKFKNIDELKNQILSDSKRAFAVMQEKAAIFSLA